MTIRQVLAVVLISVSLAGTAQAQDKPILRAAAAPHLLRDAVARQHQPLQAARTGITMRAPHRHNSTATKITAGVAMGFAGALAGALTTYGVGSVAPLPGSNQSAMWAGTTIGAGAGAALGVWLASR